MSQAVVQVVELPEHVHLIARQIADEMRLSFNALLEHAIVSLWLEVQIKRAVAKIK